MDREYLIFSDNIGADTIQIQNHMNRCIWQILKIQDTDTSWIKRYVHVRDKLVTLKWLNIMLLPYSTKVSI